MISTTSLSTIMVFPVSTTVTRSDWTVKNYPTTTTWFVNLCPTQIIFLHANKQYYQKLLIFLINIIHKPIHTLLFSYQHYAHYFRCTAFLQNLGTFIQSRQSRRHIVNNPYFFPRQRIFHQLFDFKNIFHIFHSFFFL